MADQTPDQGTVIAPVAETIVSGPARSGIRIPQALQKAVVNVALAAIAAFSGAIEGTHGAIGRSAVIAAVYAGIRAAASAAAKLADR